MKKIIVLFSFCMVLHHANAQNYPELIEVTGGTFIMGTNNKEKGSNDAPEHKVQLSTYKISKTEVTVAQYRTYCKAAKQGMPETPFWGWHNNHPIVNVSWHDAIAYCEWLSKKLGKKVTLPTEAQWEYAARGGNQSNNYKFAGSNSMPAVGWYNLNARGEVHPVATNKANELGLYDMSGNVWEWCLDWYDANYYKTSPTNNPHNNLYKGSEFRVVRGGAYYCTACCDSTHRDNNMPNKSFDSHGFRVVSY